MVAGTLAFTETVSWGILYYAFSVFLIPMRDEFGWSAATLTGGFLALPARLRSRRPVRRPVVGPPRSARADDRRVRPRRAPRRRLVARRQLALYYLIWGGIGLATAATLYEPAFATVTRWFERDRGRALLLVTVAAGFASTIALPLSSWLVDRFAWRTALLILAGILAVTTIPPHALLLRRRPEDLGLLPDGAAPRKDDAIVAHAVTQEGVSVGEALRDPPFAG